MQHQRSIRTWRQDRDEPRGRLRSVPHMTEAELALRQVTSTYVELEQALAEEHRLATLTCRLEEVESVYRQWAIARRRVEECREEYDAAVAICKERSNASGGVRSPAGRASYMTV